jgi:hypothetical protein
MPPKCINLPSTFCYDPDSFTMGAQRRKITPDYQKLYQLKIGCSLGYQGRTEHLMLYVHRVQMDNVTG